jgi:hypothetical protein
MTEEIDFESLQEMWESAAEVRDIGPSSGLMTLGTARYIASRMGDDYQVHPGLKEVFDNPEYSDSMFVEFVGESFMVRK